MHGAGIARSLARGLILGYRYGLSPLWAPTCRFAPSCSEYALDAVDRHGALKGSYLALRRFLRCHPWGGSGFDPVPERQFTPTASAGRRH